MTAASPDDFYALLDIDAEADETKVRAAWRRLALLWHPDRAGTDATATFQRLLAAYTVLSDPIARAAYDRRRGIPVRRAAAPPPVRRRAPGVMLRRLTGPLNALLACGVARYAEGDVIDLFVNAQEASEGGMATISMQVPVVCSACATDATGSCARCGTARTVDELFSAWLSVPPGVAEGTILKPSVQLRGVIRPVAFRVRLQPPYEGRSHSS